VTLVLFDLDGTLVDSGPGIRSSVRHAARVAGAPEPTDEQLRALIGPPFPAAFVDVLGVDTATAAVMMAAYHDVYGDGGLYDVRVYDGVPALLETLAADGTALAVTTSKPRVYAERVVRHVGLADAFDAGVFGVTLDGSVEGKAAVVGLALDAHPGEVVTGLVGDRHHDVEGARAHGLPCVGAAWGFGGRAELEAAGAVRVVDTPAEVPGALAALLPTG
jgi:phosphoglycolate phosphatase